MYIDKYISWNFHILQLSKKLSRANGILSKLHHNAPIEVYYAIFYSHLMYGCKLWVLQLRKIFTKSKASIKNVYELLPSDFNSHTNLLFFEHKILKIRNVIKLQQLKISL